MLMFASPAASRLAFVGVGAGARRCGASCAPLAASGTRSRTAGRRSRSWWRTAAACRNSGALADHCETCPPRGPQHSLGRLLLHRFAGLDHRDHKPPARLNRCGYGAIAAARLAIDGRQGCRRTRGAALRLDPRDVLLRGQTGDVRFGVELGEVRVLGNDRPGRLIVETERLEAVWFSRRAHRLGVSWNARRASSQPSRRKETPRPLTGGRGVPGVEVVHPQHRTTNRCLNRNSAVG